MLQACAFEECVVTNPKQAGSFAGSKTPAAVIICGLE